MMIAETKMPEVEVPPFVLAMIAEPKMPEVEDPPFVL